MMEVIIGGSGSGKSRYAEKLIEQNAKEGLPRYYIATMKVYGDEGKSRVRKHREQRKNLGFITIEQETEIEKAIGKMTLGKGATLVECISNLVANEMFDGKNDFDPEKILKGIRQLKTFCEPLIVVTNNVFEDGGAYDEETKRYMDGLAGVNAGLIQMADKVTEVVAGIPVPLKGEEKR